MIVIEHFISAESLLGLKKRFFNQAWILLRKGRVTVTLNTKMITFKYFISIHYFNNDQA